MLCRMAIVDVGAAWADRASRCAMLELCRFTAAISALHDVQLLRCRALEKFH